MTPSLPSFSFLQVRPADIAGIKKLLHLTGSRRASHCTDHLLRSQIMLSGHSFYTAVTKGHNVNATISLGIDLHLTASSQELKWVFFNRNNKDAD